MGQVKSVARTVAAEMLESRVLLAAVVGRHLFYNGSRLDGRDVSANAADDAAIAINKSALLPGQAAGFTNLISYDRGITGLMVDLSAPPSVSALTASDFSFEVGRGNGLDWAPAPQPEARRNCTWSW